MQSFGQRDGQTEQAKASPGLPRCKSSDCFRFRFLDRKSTRLNSSHLVISYAVFCLKKKKQQQSTDTLTKKITRAILSQLISLSYTPSATTRTTTMLTIRLYG